MGRFGKFWKFGLREYGAHTTSQMLRGFNRLLLASLANLVHNEAIVRFFTKQNNIKTRLLFVLPIVVHVFVFNLFYLGFYDSGFVGPALSQ